MDKQQSVEKLLREIKELPFEEGWKDNIMAAVIAAAGLVGSGKSNAQSVSPAMSQSASSATLKSSFGNLFQSGQYIFDATKKGDIKTKLEEIGNFLKANPSATFEVKLSASESQVPNSGVNMKPGELANKRAQSVQDLMQYFIKNLKDKGVFTGEVKFSEPSIAIGSTAYKQGDNSKDPKFTKEQFINADIKLVSKGKPATVDYKVSAGKKEPIYLDNKLVGTIQYASLSSADIKKSGGLNTGKEDAIFQGMNSNTGKPEGEQVKIPGDWWNKNVRNSTISNSVLAKIKSGNFI